MPRVTDRTCAEASTGSNEITSPTASPKQFTLISRRGIKLGLRNDLLELARNGPQQLRGGAARIFKIIHLDSVALPADQRHRPAVLRGGVVRPIVDELLAVDPQAHAFIGDGIKRVN